MKMKMKESSSLNFLDEIRFFIARLMIGKKSIVGNCKLIDVEINVNNEALIYNCNFVYKTTLKLDRINGITLRPVSNRGKK